MLAELLENPFVVWVLLRGAELGVVVYLEYKVAEAKHDGVTNAKDTFYASLLQRVDSARYERATRKEKQVV